jgi:dihydroceramide fatty acyl 2-hydroxylase
MRRADHLRASPPMFESRFIDRFSRVHHLVPVVIFAPAVVVLFVLALSKDVSPLLAVGLVVGGYVFWSLSEYWIHRVIFHFEPERGLGARFHWIIHGVHHEHPQDPMRLVMPPAVSVPLSSLFVLAFVAVLGVGKGFAFGAGFLGGYLLYDMVHYHLHHHASKTRLGRWLRELHMRHHFQDDTRGFGISAPYWDWVFRTPTDRARRVQQAAE